MRLRGRQYAAENMMVRENRKPNLSLLMFEVTNEVSHLGAKFMKSSILVFLVLLAVTPVLKTLTEATSSDSIWALAAILFIVNALLADFSEPVRKMDDLGQPDYRLTSVLSMNAAISASVVLASRLKSNLDVFSLVILAVMLFSLFPLVREQLKVRLLPYLAPFALLMCY
jgi:phosphatidylinositol glycan class C protein